MREAVQKSVQRERRLFGSNRVRPNVCVPILCVWCGSYCAPLCGAIVRRVLCKGARSIANLRCELSLSVWCGVCARVPPAEGDPVYARSESSDTVFHMRKITQNAVRYSSLSYLTLISGCRDRAAGPSPSSAS